MPKGKKKTGKKKGGQGSANAIMKYFMKSDDNTSNEQLCMSDLKIHPLSGAYNESIPRNWENQTYFVRDVCETSTNWTSGGTVYATYQFILSAFYKANVIATVFDQYAMHAVKVQFVHEIQNSSVTPGEFGSCIDFDSAATPTGFGQLEDYNNFRMSPIAQGQEQTRFLMPCTTPFVYQSGTSLGSFNVGRYWVDSANTSVPHFGIKYAVHGNTTAFTTRLFITGIFAFKNSV